MKPEERAQLFAVMRVMLLLPPVAVMGGMFTGAVIMGVFMAGKYMGWW
ncbi:MAG: hypothetical protein JWQ03_599 [Variovorax sp.]|nr:hypothetical protein [Variovorax sp.]